MKPNSVLFICHGASHFRTDLHETVHSAKILSFTTYAASRLLQTPRGLEPKSRVYKAFADLTRNYLRADIDRIVEWSVKYGLVSASDELQNTNANAVLKRPLVRDLLLIMETLLMEYLSQNWDSVDEIVSLNCQHSALRKPTRPLITKGTDPSRHRALRNWQKAYRLAIREVIISTLGVQRRILMLSDTFIQLKHTPQSSSLLQENHLSSKPKRRPVLLMLGGGMAAGKSTIRERIKTGKLQTQISEDAIVIEADAIKNQDIVYKALKERLGDDLDLSPLVHDFSTALAEEMLVRAVNQQQDVIFDGTMTWFPFVEQTIKMVRDYKHNYKRGLGYSLTPSGQVVESYWEIDRNMDSEIDVKLPYRIEIVGVTCDPGLAVARGIWRRIRTGRSVPIANQLRSHRLFSQNFKAISKLVDSATLYHTGNNLTTFTHLNNDLEPPKVICRCDSTTQGQLLVDRERWQEFTRNKCLKDSANSVLTLYSDQESLGYAL